MIALFGIAATVVLQERIVAATAVGAVVIGFALQDTLGNLFAGLAIQIEKPFRVGHWVQLAGKDGIVSEITWRATKIRTKSGNLVIVPNSMLSKDMITNYSEPSPLTRLEVEVGASYDATPHDVKSTILDALAHEPLILREPAPQVLLVDFAASAVTYRVWVWTDDFGDDERIKERLRTLIYYALRRRAISIPYPMQVQINQEPAASPATEEQPATVAAVGAVEIFSSLTPEERAWLLRESRVVTYTGGETIVRQGQPGASMFVVVRGRTRVTIDPSGQEVATGSPGAFFGEMSLLTGESRTATVTAVTECDLVEITTDAFRRLVLTNPAAVEKVGAIVAKRAAELARMRAASSATAPVTEPPANFIARARRFLGLTAILVAAVAASAGAAGRETQQLTGPDGRRAVTAIEVRTPIVAGRAGRARREGHEGTERVRTHAVR